MHNGNSLRADRWAGSEGAPKPSSNRLPLHGTPSVERRNVSSAGVDAAEVLSVIG